jgi:hypothetical protein
MMDWRLFRIRFCCGLASEEPSWLPGRGVMLIQDMLGITLARHGVAYKQDTHMVGNASSFEFTLLLFIHFIIDSS